jgi:outer membrane murein-binding lipoprotein Lpp
MQTMAITQLIPQMVSAIKELSAKVEALENAN